MNKHESILFVHVSSLKANPDNPRKDLGDLTELTASIRENGVMQNLTVVPAEKGYTVVIGHRRLAAAKEAGLSEVPCVVTNMNKKQQVATMLLENMQRNDLTILEQAQGFQLMFDLGDSIADISHMTGLSESTVRRRTNLLKLDQDELKKSVERGATLMDFVKLEEIKDETLRNEALKEVGTKNFNWKLRDCKDREKWMLRKKEIIDDLETYATQVSRDDEETRSELTYKTYFNRYSYKDYEKPEDAETRNYFFLLENDAIRMMHKKEDKNVDETVDPEEQIRRGRLKEKSEKLEEISKTAYTLRQAYIQEFNATKEHFDSLIREGFKYIAGQDYMCLEKYDIVERMGISDEEELDFQKIESDLLKRPYQYLFFLISSMFSDGVNNSYHNYWDKKYCEDEDLDRLYNFLTAIGYEMSDDERMLQNGTHPLYKDIEDLRAKE